jgi:CSLREA domain-containing protein
MSKPKWGIRTAIVCGALAAALLAPSGASAVVLTPNTTADEYNSNPGACSLREAIDAANTDSAANADGCPQGNGADEIRLTAGATYEITLPGVEGLNASGDFDIRLDDLTISAPAQGAIIDGNGLTTNDRVIEIANFNPPITVNISNVTIRDGGGPASTPGISGGGIGLYGASEAHVLNLTNSTIEGNRGIVGGGIQVGTVGTANLRNVTFSNNSASVDGGALASDGAVLLSNSTVTKNVANADGDFIGGGGGLVATSDTIQLRNTIMQGNTDAGQGAKENECDGAGTLASLGNNVVGVVTDCTYVAGAGDQIAVTSAGLLPLAANGGPVFTHGLSADSPALNKGAACEVDDARGLPRTFGGTCDVGAYERATCGDFGPKKTRLINVVGTAGPDQLNGVHGGTADGIAGLGGDDTLKGLGAGDCILGGAGRDRLFGGDGKDQLFGGAGKDTLKGNKANDRLAGGKGKDNCSGGKGKKDSVKSCEKGKA